MRIADALPHGAYEFQATLSNGNRPDCVVRMPNDLPSLVIDAKFPLEAWNAIRNSEMGEGLKSAQAKFRNDIRQHIRAIKERYLIAGETLATAVQTHRLADAEGTEPAITVAVSR